VVASIDVRRGAAGYELYSDCGRMREPVTLADHIRAVVEHGAGEIFVNSIDRDGTMQGYDIELIRLVTRCARIPVIACGGAGNYDHMKDAFCATDVSALACGSLFNFGDNNPIRAKAFLSNYQIPFKVV
jgi:cyclase